MSDLRIVDIGERREKEKAPTPQDLLDAFRKMLDEEGFDPDHVLILAHKEEGDGDSFAFAALPKTTNKDVLWILQKTITVLMEEPGQ